MLTSFKKWLIIVLASFLMSEVNMAGENKPIEIPIHPVLLEIKTKQGVVSYSVEIASTPSQTRAGLMYRTDFPKNHAMLFKNQIGDQLKDKQKFFMWMANTPLPLDMIFLNNEGIIVSIIENTSPFSTDIISSEVPAIFALEVNAGEVFEKKIEKGQHVIHPAICGECKGNKI
ncbi:uncharacterized membrane protein (UPF0127 family) [Bartonella japonica]|uniref:Uncharacterized membrane protein (UPF0127 family) n=1 Tax=Bartonella japonica TaxID=357761 RepID=A0ABV2FN57_9HYPH